MYPKVTGTIISFLVFLFVQSVIAAPGSFTLVSPANGGCAGPRPAFDWTNSSGAVRYTLTIQPSSGSTITVPNITYSNYTLTQNLSEAGNVHIWWVTAYDSANDPTTSSSQSFFVDATAPTAFYLLGPENNSWHKNSEVTFSWQPSADSGCAGLKRFRLYVDGNLCLDNIPVATTSVPLSSLSCTLSEGPHTWRVVAEDNVGNLTWCSQSPGGSGGWTVNLDNYGPGKEPTVSYWVSGRQTPAYGMYQGRSVTIGQQIVFSATGTWCRTHWCDMYCNGPDGISENVSRPAPQCLHASLIAQIGTSGAYKCVGSSSTHLAEATGDIYLGMNNGSIDNCSTRGLTVNVTVSTLYHLLTPAANAVIGEASPTFSWTAMPDASGSQFVTYEVIVDGATVTAPILDTTFDLQATLADGIHSWRVKGYDLVGNTSESSTRSFIVDTTPPTAFKTTTPTDESCTSLPTPTLCWQASTDATGIAKYQLWIDGNLSVDNIASGNTCTTPASPLAYGVHEWYVVALDQLGHARQSTTGTGNLPSSTVIYDSQPPSAFSQVSPADGSTIYTTLPEFAWTASSDNVGLDHYELWVDGALNADNLPPANLSYTLTSALTVGSHNWQVKAFDRCGYSNQTAIWTMTTYTCEPGVIVACEGNSIGECDPGTRTCQANGTWAACVGVIGPIAELCNALDDDCDTQTDEDFNLNQACAVGQGECQRTGVTVCSANGLGVVCNATPGDPVPEMCNGLDDDCDTQTDEDFNLGSACSVGLGICQRNGVMVCNQAGDGAVCDAVPGEPGTETCNNLDDDCDGDTDNGFSLGGNCSVGTGTCLRNGVMVCNAAGTGTECSAVVGDPEAERCNSLDDDCDTQTDEDFALGVSCAVGLGECLAHGVMACDPAEEIEACDAEEGPPTAETCDGLDNDCDGATDEGCGCQTGASRPCGPPDIGECVSGIQYCDGDNLWSDCLGPEWPSEEICDGLDNDCDSTTDEGCECSGTETQPCGPDAGICAPGTQHCQDGRWEHCQDGTLPEEEVCDGLDNDCDSLTDENCQQGVDAGPDSGADGDADTDADSDSDTDSDVDSDADADTDADTDADVDSDTDADNDSDVDSDTDADTDLDADADSGTDADVDADSDTDTDSDTDADADSDSGTDAANGSDSDTDGDTDSDSSGTDGSDEESESVGSADCSCSAVGIVVQQPDALFRLILL